MASLTPKVVVSRAALVRLAASWHKRRRTVVFTNGVFDVLHRGHIDLFEFASKSGDIVVVGMNSDASTRRLKGPTRPINNQRDRARLLAALKPVDHVCIFPEDTPLRLIQAFQPDVLIKGSEYASGEIVGAAEVRSWGGRVKRFRMREGYSSSALIAHMRSETGS